jgi:hypothetical protein
MIINLRVNRLTMKILILSFMIALNLLVSKDVYADVDIKIWKVFSAADDILSPIQNGHFSGFHFINKKNQGSRFLLARDYAPMSINGIKNQIKNLGGKAETLKIIKLKNKTIFRFSSDQFQYHFFSTRGGYLQMTLDKISQAQLKNNFDEQVQ